MPSSRPTKPIIVNAQRPSHQPSNLAPASPPSPKTVRFAPRSAEVSSRPLTAQEAWSLYHFENHARACSACYRHALCDVGYNLSQDVRVLVFQHGGQLCSTRPDSEGKWVRVEVPHGYDRVKVLLGAERSGSRKKPAPVVSYDAPEQHEPSRRRESASVVVEPARTRRDEDRKSRQRAQRYEVVEVTPASVSDHDSKNAKAEPVRLPERVKKGSLYESDMNRPRREYRLEERAPGKRERRDRGRQTEWRESDRDDRREWRWREREA